MAQGLIGGATSYKVQSLKDILNDIFNWIEMTRKEKEFLFQCRYELAKNNYWDSIPADFVLTLEASLQYMETILEDLESIYIKIKDNIISEREVKLLKSIGLESRHFNIEYGKNYHKYYMWHNYKDPNFKIAEKMYQKGRSFFVTMQDAANASGRLEDYMSKENTNNTINIMGDVTGTQIQQGTLNSVQTITNSSQIDYLKILGILSKIRKTCDTDIFNEEFGKEAGRFKKILEDTTQMVDKKGEKSKIKTSLSILKEIAVEVSGSVIASGILYMIQQINI